MDFVENRMRKLGVEKEYRALQGIWDEEERKIFEVLGHIEAGPDTYITPDSLSPSIYRALREANEELPRILTILFSLRHSIPERGGLSLDSRPSVELETGRMDFDPDTLLNNTLRKFALIHERAHLSQENRSLPDIINIMGYKIRPKEIHAQLKMFEEIDKLISKKGSLGRLYALGLYNLLREHDIKLHIDGPGLEEEKVNYILLPHYLYERGIRASHISKLIRRGEFEKLVKRALKEFIHLGAIPSNP